MVNPSGTLDPFNGNFLHLFLPSFSCAGKAAQSGRSPWLGGHFGGFLKPPVIHRVGCCSVGNRCAARGALLLRPTASFPLGPRRSGPVRLCRAGADGRLARRLPYRVHRERLRWPTKKAGCKSLILPEPAAGQKKAVGIRSLRLVSLVFQRFIRRDLLSLPQAPYGASWPLHPFVGWSPWGPVFCVQSPR